MRSRSHAAPSFAETDRGYGYDAALEEAWRCLQCEDPPCEKGCPAAVGVRTFIRKIRNHDLVGAALTVRAANVLGGSCARVCATDEQCRRECTRSKLDRAIDIAGLQRFVCDYERKTRATFERPGPDTGKRVAVVGSGPAGLAAAAELARLGHRVTVLERERRPGGMLSHGIPAMRLPLSVVRHEIAALQKLGVRFRAGRTVRGLADLKGFDAAIVALGLTRGARLGIPGEDLPGVRDALAVLGAKASGKKLRLGRRVVVIGGGNTAMDAARTALRLGAREVTVIYRRAERDMPAWSHEIERARAEGVDIRPNTMPLAFVRRGKKLGAVRCAVTVPGEVDQSGRARPVPVKGATFDLAADDVLVAAGEQADEALCQAFGLEIREGVVVRRRGGARDGAAVFVAGDLAQRERTVVQALADGREAARRVDAHLGGPGKTATLPRLPEEVDLGISFCGVKFKNPFLLAAAPPTDDLEMLRAGLRAGWAGAVLKTTAVESEPVELKYPMMTGYDVFGRRVVGLGNIDLISEHHIDVIEKRMQALRGEFPDRVLVGSIMGSARSDWETLVRRLEAAGADIIECSFSCPQGTLGGEGSFSGQMLGQNVELTRQVTSWIKGAARRCPVVIKITPQVADIAAVANAVREGGADAVCASNTIPSLMGVDVERFQPLPDVGGLASFSGLSGPAILPITLRNIALVAQHSKLPVTGTGGPANWRDAAQMMLVGAHNVQFCTAVMTFGYDIIDDLVSGLAWHLRALGLHSPAELVGRALPRLATHDRLQQKGKVRSRIDERQCVRCGRCVITCRDGGHRAIDFGRDRRPRVDDERCVGCGMCAAVCPVSGTIRMQVLAST
ncbi:MAG: NAD-dependent dihydropyrimidine dehydrogenase subunit PreA [Myxococcales bacterium]|nr:NAD-dependent dihydropyrimidine dehydrogenase subunit PreA [Myxococcales bacterium]